MFSEQLLISETETFRQLVWETISYLSVIYASQLTVITLEYI